MDKKKTREGRKPYAPPRLIKYGDLRRLTGGSSNKKTEAGGIGPKTKAGPAA